MEKYKEHLELTMMGSKTIWQIERATQVIGG